VSDGPSFSTWVSALVPRLGDLARSYLPLAPVDARRRELLVATVAESLGCEPLAWVHRSWHCLLGPAELSEIDDEVAAWAVAVALAGPLGGVGAQLDALPDELSTPARRTTLALVAHTAASAAAIEATAGLVDRLRGRPSPDAATFPAQVGASVFGVALVAPTAAAGVVVSVLARMVPAPATVLVDPDPNLLTLLLAETLPTWFGSAWGRTLVARLPVAVPVAVRSGRVGSTVRVGDGRIEVANGIADDAWAVFDGEVDALVRAASLHLTREVRSDRLAR
jgi:hypothetical protein